jgi:hypothetical protein
MARAISDAWFHRIKAATRDLIRASGGIERAAALTSYSKSDVGRWNIATDPQIVPLAAALALEAECGLPLITSVMAELNGRRLTDGTETGEASSIAARHADTQRASAEVLARYAQATADNRLTPAEAEIIDRAVAELERSIGPLRQDLAAAKVVALKP